MESQTLLGSDLSLRVDPGSVVEESAPRLLKPPQPAHRSRLQSDLDSDLGHSATTGQPQQTGLLVALVRLSTVKDLHWFALFLSSTFPHTPHGYIYEYGDTGVIHKGSEGSERSRLQRREDGCRDGRRLQRWEKAAETGGWLQRWEMAAETGAYEREGER